MGFYWGVVFGTYLSTTFWIYSWIRQRDDAKDHAALAAFVAATWPVGLALHWFFVVRRIGSTVEPTPGRDGSDE